MVYLTNALSINMLPYSFELSGKLITPSEAASVLEAGFTPAIGHVDTAAVVAADLGLDPEPIIEAASQRPSVSAGYGDRLVVAQYRGPRLPEGTTRLPEGASIHYYLVSIEADIAWPI